MKPIIYLGKIVLCTISLTVGTWLGSVLASGLGLNGPQMPPAVDLRLVGLLSLLGGVALAAALAEIARRLSGGFAVRWLGLAWFVYAGMGLANTLEAAVFTSVGGHAWLLVFWVPVSLLLAGVVALVFRPTAAGVEPGTHLRASLAERTRQQRVVHLAAVWLAFPAVYVCFGVPAGLVVGNAYRAQAFGLRLPGPEVILALQLVRGLLVLLGALPLLLAWAASRHRFWLSYGLGLFAVLGLYGLIQAYWLPVGMRAVHTVEILLDCLVYSWVLTRLLLARERPQAAAETGMLASHDSTPN